MFQGATAAWETQTGDQANSSMRQMHDHQWDCGIHSLEGFHALAGQSHGQAYLVLVITLL